MLLGLDQDGESWHMARLDLRVVTLRIEELVRVPFARRSPMFDGSDFRTNHRASSETVTFFLPNS